MLLFERTLDVTLILKDVTPYLFLIANSCECSKATVAIYNSPNSSPPQGGMATTYSVNLISMMALCWVRVIRSGYEEDHIQQQMLVMLNNLLQTQ